jgi:hypothetical protein
MRHRTHDHRTVAGTARVLWGTVAGNAEAVPAALTRIAPEWSL